MLGDDLAQEHHLDHAVLDPELDAAADVVVRHRVAGRAEPHAAQLVHLAGHDLADGGPERRQVGEQLPLVRQPLGGDSGDLGMDDAVHLVAPEPTLLVGRGQVGDGECFGDHEVGLHVADQVLHQALGLGVGPLAEVGPEPVVGGEAHVGRGRDDQPGDRAALQAAHAVGQRGLRHAADALEALGQGLHGGLGPEVVGEVHEAIPAPADHGTEDEQRADLPPVEHHHVARCPHARSSAPVVLRPPGALGLGHQTAEVAGRAAIAGSHRHRQQTLGRDPALGAGHGLGHQVGHPVVVVADQTGIDPGLGPPGRLDRSLDGLRRGSADVGCGPIGAHLSIGGMHVHVFPH